MKIKTTFLFIILTIGFLDGMAQDKYGKKDSTTYEYAILRMQTYLFNPYYLDIILPDNQIIDLTKKLKLDTVKLPEYFNDRPYKFLFKGIKYLDQIGYELINSSVNFGNKGARECIFRRKRKTNP
jgi:hypothetical protein